MSIKKSILNFTLQEFKENIKSVEDFPSLEEFIKWGDKHRVYIVSAFNHLVYTMKPKFNNIFDLKIKKVGMKPT
ncbi:MAG: hypothetical protein IJ371_05980 [Clostridia bacterium]|nr:hypothetical protein [Clostridia bacterium]